MSHEILVDPAWLRSDFAGSRRYHRTALDLASRTSTEDVYFEAIPEGDGPASPALDALLEQLAPALGAAVRLRVLESMSFREIAVELAWYTPRRPLRGRVQRPDKKRAWRAVHDGLAALRHQIATSEDLMFLVPGSDD